jgi:hypothetical protein
MRSLTVKVNLIGIEPLSDRGTGFTLRVVIFLNTIQI